MSYSIVPTDNFIRESKHLAKKYRSLKHDLKKLGNELLINPFIGAPIGHSIYKIRMAVSSKGKGKSGGARVISYVFVKKEQIFLLSIYDKSEKENISENEIKQFLKNLPVI